eukprot:scaffold140_cov247-Pinguiococcus_pyrenoidosus.AAC.21
MGVDLCEAEVHDPDPVPAPGLDTVPRLQPSSCTPAVGGAGIGITVLRGWIGVIDRPSVAIRVAIRVAVLVAVLSRSFCSMCFASEIRLVASVGA